MKSRKFYLGVAILFIVSLVLVACGGGNGGNTEEEGADGGNGATETGGSTQLMNFLTGGTSGTYYPLGGEIAKIITDETGIQVDAQSSNASADNVIALANGEAELAFVQTDVVAHAVEGVHSFEGKAVSGVMALGSLYPETVQIVVLADSDIQSVEDLKGKKVSVGAPGSGTYVNALQILEAHGLTMDDIDAQNLDFGESTDGIQDGLIDAAFITAGTPTGAVEGLAATHKVRILPIEQDKIDALIEKYPFYAEDVVPAGTYGLEEDVKTVAVMAMIAVNENLSEDDVYNITKAIFENVDQLTHDKAKFISIDSALDGVGIPLHPGAEKYYKEVGVLD